MTAPFRPRTGRLHVPTGSLAALAISTAVGVGLWESARPHAEAVDSELRARAARAERRMQEAAAQLAEAKTAAGLAPESGVSAREMGLVGAELTPLVTTLGSLESKRLATSPRWAFEIAVRLHRAGLRRGDVVAASFSGSFPGLNLAVAAACAELGVRLIAVSSVTASTWGANQPGFTWPEMEARLVKAGTLPRATVAVSLGGDDDAARDLSAADRALAHRIARSAALALGAELVQPRDFEDAVKKRLAIYHRHANGRRIALYVNCGGNHASLGRSTAFLRMQSGFLRPMPFDVGAGQGVMARLAAKGVPVLHLLNVRGLALRWRLVAD